MREGGTADVEAGHLAASGHLFLREFSAIPQFANLRPHDVRWKLLPGHGGTPSVTLIPNCETVVTPE